MPAQNSVEQLELEVGESWLTPEALQRPGDLPSRRDDRGDFQHLLPKR